MNDDEKVHPFTKNRSEAKGSSWRDRFNRFATYDRSLYEREVKAALELWSEHVLALIEGRESKVVPLHA